MKTMAETVTATNDTDPIRVAVLCEGLILVVSKSELCIKDVKMDLEWLEIETSWS